MTRARAPAILPRLGRSRSLHHVEVTMSESIAERAPGKPGASRIDLAVAAIRPRPSTIDMRLFMA